MFLRKIAYEVSGSEYQASLKTLLNNLMLLNLSKESRKKKGRGRENLLKSNAQSHLRMKGLIMHISHEVILVKRARNRATISPPQIPCALIFANWHFVNPMLIVFILVHGPIRSSCRITKYSRKHYQ